MKLTEQKLRLIIRKLIKEGIKLGPDEIKERKIYKFNNEDTGEITTAKIKGIQPRANKEYEIEFVDENKKIRKFRLNINDKWFETI